MATANQCMCAIAFASKESEHVNCQSSPLFFLLAVSIGPVDLNALGQLIGAIG